MTPSTSLAAPPPLAESTSIAANRFTSLRFRALVPEMERKFSGWNRLQKTKTPTCSEFLRWS